MRQTQRPDLWTRGVKGEEREGGMYGERNMETYITVCKIDSQWEVAIRLGELRHGLCNNLEVWDGEEGGRGNLWGEDVCMPMADLC